MWCIGMYTEWFALRSLLLCNLRTTIVLLEDTVVLTTAVPIGM
jgi:hypothetical protein